MRCVIILHLLLISVFSFAQTDINYSGALILNNNTPISFKLELIEKQGVVNGISITNIGTKDETKSEIIGLYFKSDKSFQLQETKILKTKSESELNTFCYITMNLSFKGLFKAKRLEGTFIGNFLDSTECARGKVILMKEENLNKKIEKIHKKIEKIFPHKDHNTNFFNQQKS